MWSVNEAWRIDTIPSLEIGSRFGTGGDAFGSIAGVVRLPDGTIVVLDAVEKAVKYFGANGAFLASAGREGDGPGEFRRPSWIGVCDDSIFVTDYRTNRLSVFGPDRRFARSFRLQGRHPSSISCGQNGSLLYSVRSPEPIDMPIGPYRGTEQVYLAGSDGEVLVELGEFPGPDRYRFERSDMPADLGRQLTHAIVPTGILIGTGDDYEINVLDHQGNSVRTIAWDGPDLTITDADWSQYVDRSVAAVPDDYPEQRTILARFLAERDPVTRLPAYTRFLSDTAGFLWVEGPPPPAGGPPPWFVFDAEGMWLGSVAVPQAFRIKQIGDDWILGSWSDADGVDYVRSYGLDRR